MTGFPPDVLYHATTEERAGLYREREVIEIGGGRPIFLSRDERPAWLAAHRQRGVPTVLYVDVPRAQRDGVHFDRDGPNRWRARALPSVHVLNLRDDFAHQASAGGIPIWWPSGPGLPLEALLIHVRRFHGATWEIAKGKLEAGETPRDAAAREVREELGVATEFEVLGDLGTVRYGFRTPKGAPRLKTLHVFLMRAPERIETFAPAGAEGVLDVRWFPLEDAARAVAHRSLKPVVQRTARWLQ